MSQIKRKQIKLELSQGPANSAYGTVNSPGVLNSDTLEEATDKIIRLLDMLAPPSAPTIAQVPFSLANGSFRTALAAGTLGPLLTNITSQTSPKFISPGPVPPPAGLVVSPYPQYFTNGSKGYLSFKEDTLENVDIAGTRVIPATDSATQLVNGRTIVMEDNKDYWEGIAGRAGFVRAVRASFQDSTHAPGPNENLMTAQHTMNLPASATPLQTGENALTYRVESIASPVVDAVFMDTALPYSYTSGNTISGVPSLGIGDRYNIRAAMREVVRFYYLSQPLTLNSNGFNQCNATGGSIGTPWQWPAAPAANTAQTGTTAIAHYLTPKPGVFFDAANNALVSFTATDSLGTVSPATNLSTAAMRIDTVSNTAVDNTRRRLSGIVSSSIQDASGMTTAYSHAQQIVGNANALYNNELQLENGKYVYPTQNYNNYIPLFAAGIQRNYTGQSGVRAATWLAGTATDINTIVISTPGLTSRLNADSSFKVLVRLGVNASNFATAWLDATALYNGNDPALTAVNSGVLAPALIDTDSTATNRVVKVNGLGALNNGGTFQVFIRVLWDNTRTTTVLTGAPALVGFIGNGSISAL